MTVESYAMKILSDNGCDCYTYGGEDCKHVLEDLKEGYPNGMEFPYIDVANAILSISRPRPLYKAPFRMVWDTYDCCDGIDCESYGAAKCQAEDTLLEWEMEEIVSWNDGIPTEAQIEDWNYMIFNCGVSIYEYDAMADEYVERDGLSYEEEEQIGWREIDENYKPWELMEGE